MHQKKIRLAAFVGLLIVMTAMSSVAFGQQGAGKPGGVKGRVRIDGGAAAGVTVTITKGEREVARGETDRKGQFEINGVAPGSYALRFHKAGLSTAEIKDFQVVAGKVRSLDDKVFLPLDEGSLAFVSGSVFSASGRSVPNARIELARVFADGSVKRLDGRVSTESGRFTFRLAPDTARYRVTAKADGVPSVSKDVDVEGAAVYRVSLQLPPAP